MGSKAVLGIKEPSGLRGVSHEFGLFQISSGIFAVSYFLKSGTATARPSPFARTGTLCHDLKAPGFSTFNPVYQWRRALIGPQISVASHIVCRSHGDQAETPRRGNRVIRQTQPEPSGRH